MNILVIGADGQIGRCVLSAAISRGGNKVYGTSIAPAAGGLLFLDFERPESFKGVFETASPDIVVLCSAMTYVDGCETDPSRARRLNVAGPGIIVEECRRRGSKLVYLSTEYVFDGLRGPYSETDAVNPESVYGRTKLEGENIVLGLKDALSVRTTVVYSFEPGGKNFIMQLVDNHRTGKKMRVPADQYSNPTYAPELADFILELVFQRASGIFNVVGRDRMNRHEFALKACEVFGFRNDFIEAGTTAELHQAAKRPLNAGLKTEKLQKFLGRSPEGVGKNLRLILSELKRYGYIG